MNRHKCRHRGQGLAEYGLLLGLVVLVVIVIIGVFGEALVQLYQNILDQL